MKRADNAGPILTIVFSLAVIAGCLYLAAASSDGERCPAPSAVSVEALFAPCAAMAAAPRAIDAAEQWQSQQRRSPG
jgi:hypothetical protein